MFICTYRLRAMISRSLGLGVLTLIAMINLGDSERGMVKSWLGAAIIATQNTAFVWIKSISCESFLFFINVVSRTRTRKIQIQMFIWPLSLCDPRRCIWGSDAIG
jgi:hypothetical protein